MDFELTEEQRLFRDQIRNFAEKEIGPLVEEAEETETTPLELFPKMGKLGYLGVTYPAKYGGAETDKITECILIEELSKVCAGITGAVGTTHSGLGLRALNAYGTEEQKQRFLAPAIKGEKIAAFALTEADAGSDALAMRTRAVKDGTDYIINGSKMFISNGTFCDFVPVACYTSDPKTVKRGKGINLLVVEKGMPGFTARKLKKVGNRSHETAELFFDNVRVPKENLIGEEGEGLSQILTTIFPGRLTYGARATGLGQAAYDIVYKYAQERVQFGNPIAKFQANTFKLVDIAMSVDIMRLMTYRAAWLYDQPGAKYAKEAFMVKIFTTETLQQVMLKALSIHGGYGYMREYPIERIWRDAKMLNITEGTTEMAYLAAARELKI